MKPVIYNADYLFDENLINFPFLIEIHVTRFLNNNYPQYILKQKINTSNEDNTLISDNHYEILNDSYRIFIDSNEPSVCTLKEIEEDIIKYANFYKLILTSNENILKKIPHAKLFLYGTTWLNKSNDKHTKIYLGEILEDFNGFDIKKENNISFLKSNKPLSLIQKVPGYNLREKIWLLKNKIQHKTYFYYGNVSFNNTFVINDGVLPNDDKLNIFNSKFSIIIENSKEKNYFSEKLIDCLLTRTIPLYWGCPNIDEYFDIDGFIVFKDENHLIDILNDIDIEKIYDLKQKHIENNFIIAKKYAKNFSKRLEEEIKKYI